MYQNGKANILEASSQQRRYLRNHLMGMVYQNPMLGLRMNISSGAKYCGKAHRRGQPQRRPDDRPQLPASGACRDPRGTSAGPAPGLFRRHAAAGADQQAIANNPPILLLDEVTTGLDLSVQAKVLDLIRTIQQELGIAMMIVSHDLSVIRMMSDRTMVMLGGRVVEEGLTDQILEDPLHAYTQTLVSSLL